MKAEQQAQTDFFITGILPELNFRFSLARLGHVAGQVAAQQETDSVISRQIGESMLAAFFLAQHSTKDEDSTISLHLELEGAPRRLIAFARSDGGMRATVAETGSNFQSDNIWQQLGRSILRVNRWLETPEGRKNYSSAVELRQAGLVKNLEEYIAHSDQIQTFLNIESGMQSGIPHIAGYFFQALPGTSADQIDAMLKMLNMRGPTNLIQDILEPDRAGNREQLESARSLRIFKQGGFYSYCDCNQQKIENVIRLNGRDEVDAIFEEIGYLEITCEFCKKKYNIARENLDAIFHPDSPPKDPGKT